METRRHSGGERAIEPSLTGVEAAGVTLAVEVWPGRGTPTLAMAHATGFCRSVWAPVIEDLRHLGVELPVVAWDHRAHGASSRPELPVDWWDVARDTLAVLEAHSGPIVGIGHSMGAAALLMAEMLEPGTLTSVVAIEPIIFPPPHVPADHHPLAVGASRRRPRFPGRAEAAAHFAGKHVFARWDRRALDGYVGCGLVEDGDGVALACPPEYESSFFARAGLHGAWDRLADVQVPVLVVAGRDSDSHPEEFAAEQARRLPVADLEVVDGSGHFLPMEQPARVAGIVRQAIESMSAS